MTPRSFRGPISDCANIHMMSRCQRVKPTVAGQSESRGVTQGGLSKVPVVMEIRLGLSELLQRTKCLLSELSYLRHLHLLLPRLWAPLVSLPFDPSTRLVDRLHGGFELHSALLYARFSSATSVCASDIHMSFSLPAAASYFRTTQGNGGGRFFVPSIRGRQEGSGGA